MNAAHIHLIVNHIPIFSVLFGVGILGWGLWKENKSVQKIALVLFVVGALASYLAIESGEGAEEIVEEYSATVSHDAIHEHEEIAEIALWFAIITGGLSLVGLVATNLNARLQKSLMIILMFSAVITVSILAFTAYKGGKIRHPEAYNKSATISELNQDIRINERLPG
jgi:uncharacterized membrane protein